MMVLIEYNEKTSLVSVKKELMWYRDRGFDAYTNINGEVIYSDDLNMDFIFERIGLNISKDYEKEYSSIKRSKEMLDKMKVELFRISNNLKLNYYMNLSKKFIDSEKIAEFQEELVLNVMLFGDLFLLIVTYLLLTLDSKDLVNIYRDINKVIASIREDTDECLNSAIKLIIKYSDKGDILNDMFFMDSTEMCKVRIDNEEYEFNCEIKKLSRK